MAYSTSFSEMPYSRINLESEEFLTGKSYSECPRKASKSCCLVCYSLLCSVLLLSIGAFAGFKFGTRVSYHPGTNLIAPTGSETVVLEYNQTFSLEPSKISNEAWESILPPTGKGFVQHPVLAPHVSSLSVFHQLHCLNSIRRGYYYSLDPSILPGGSELSTPSHVRHCFDFLRQNIMCAADTNFEPVDDELGGILGYGREKVCRDYENVKAWAEEWSARPDFRDIVTTRV